MRSEFACFRSVRPGLRWKTCSSALLRRLGWKARSERKNDRNRHRRSDMRRILEQTRKELIQVIRDKRAILMALGLPAMLLVVMPQSISLTVDDLPIVVRDLDGSDSNTAQLVSGYAKQVASAYNKGTAGATQEGPVHAAVRLWYNPGRSSNKFYAPGIFVLNLSLFAPLLASLAMAKEGEEKTI